MSLKYPQSDIPFAPTPAWFLGPFDVYDREETLGEELNRFDPNDPSKIQQLLDEYFFPYRTSERGYTSEHKREMVQVLVSALSDKGYCFATLLEDDHDSCFYLPCAWEIHVPREFFLQVYVAVLRHWSDELGGIGVKLPQITELALSK